MFPSNYLVSIQLQFWLFSFGGCGCCWAVTILITMMNLFTVINFHRTIDVGDGGAGGAIATPVNFTRAKLIRTGQ